MNVQLFCLIWEVTEGSVSLQLNFLQLMNRRHLDGTGQEQKKKVWYIEGKSLAMFVFTVELQPTRINL